MKAASLISQNYKKLKEAKPVSKGIKKPGKSSEDQIDRALILKQQQSAVKNYQTMPQKGCFSVKKLSIKDFPGESLVGSNLSNDRAAKISLSHLMRPPSQKDSEKQKSAVQTVISQKQKSANVVNSILISHQNETSSQYDLDLPAKEKYSKTFHIVSSSFNLNKHLGY